MAIRLSGVLDADAKTYGREFKRHEIKPINQGA